jgi:hypothetical protein
MKHTPIQAMRARAHRGNIHPSRKHQLIDEGFADPGYIRPLTTFTRYQHGLPNPEEHAAMAIPGISGRARNIRPSGGACPTIQTTSALENGLADAENISPSKWHFVFQQKTSAHVKKKRPPRKYPTTHSGDSLPLTRASMAK